MAPIAAFFVEAWTDGHWKAVKGIPNSIWALDKLDALNEFKVSKYSIDVDSPPDTEKGNVASMLRDLRKRYKPSLDPYPYMIPLCVMRGSGRIVHTVYSTDNWFYRSDISKDLWQLLGKGYKVPGAIPAIKTPGRMPLLSREIEKSLERYAHPESVDCTYKLDALLQFDWGQRVLKSTKVDMYGLHQYNTTGVLRETENSTSSSRGESAEISLEEMQKVVVEHDLPDRLVLGPDTNQNEILIHEYRADAVARRLAGLARDMNIHGIPVERLYTTLQTEHTREEIAHGFLTACSDLGRDLDADPRYVRIVVRLGRD